MTTIRKSASRVRQDAYEMALEARKDRLRDGDPEGSGVLLDLARAIRKMPIVISVR